MECTKTKMDEDLKIKWNNVPKSSVPSFSSGKKKTVFEETVNFKHVDERFSAFSENAEKDAKTPTVIKKLGMGLTPASHDFVAVEVAQALSE